MIDARIQQRWEQAAKGREQQFSSAQLWFSRLITLMADLHSPDGCPWDREQTLASLRQYIREEAEEVCSAIDSILEYENELRANAGLPADDPAAPTETDAARTPVKGLSIAHHPHHPGFQPHVSASGAPLPTVAAPEDNSRRDDLYQKLHNEIGDLLMQPVFLCEILSRMGRGGIEHSAEEVVRKLIRRHPHVYGELEVSDSAQVLHNWESIKREERRQDK